MNEQKSSRFSVDYILSIPRSVDGVESKEMENRVSGQNAKSKHFRKPSGNLLVDAVVQMTEEILTEHTLQQSGGSKTEETDDIESRSNRMPQLNEEDTTPSLEMEADSTRSQLVAFGNDEKEIENAMQSIDGDHDINHIIDHMDRRRETTLNQTAMESEDEKSSTINTAMTFQDFHRIDCYELFNKQQNTSCSVTIDMRSGEEFRLCHLRNAVHLDHAQSAQQIVSAMKTHLERTGKDSVFELFVYSNNVDGKSTSKRMNRIISILREQGLCPEDQAAVRILDCNFSVFFSLFPFLCRFGAQNEGQSLSSLPPHRRRKAVMAMNRGFYPHHIINDVLYLGDRKR